MKKIDLLKDRFRLPITSSDVSSQSNLEVFVRFELKGNIVEKMQFCQSLPTKTTGKEIPNLLKII